mgnify:CR=1 FL=1
MYNLFWIVSFFIVIFTIIYGIIDQFKIKTFSIPNIKTDFTGKISYPTEIIYLQLLLFLLVSVPLIDQGLYLKGILLGLLYLVPSYLLAIIVTFVSSNFKFSKIIFFKWLKYSIILILIIRIFSFIPLLSKINILYWKFLGI